MEKTKVEAYSLHQTFNCNIPTKDLSVIQKRELAAAVKHLEDDQKTAFVRLILEHSRLENVDPLTELPYGGMETKNGTMFDASELPKDLRWILYKFVKMCARDS